MTSAPVWYPSPELLRDANVVRFLRRHGIGDFDELRRRSVDEPAWFWDAMVEFLDIGFTTPYTEVLHVEPGPATEGKGIAWATWFTGGRLNYADVCLDRHAARTPERVALVWEGEDGEVVRWTWAQLRAAADALAATLAERGVGPGDAVGVYLPMLPETVATLLGIAKLGAVFLPLFSGYGAGAITARLADANARALVTADGFYRRGTPVAMKAVADDAVAGVASVRTVVVVPRLGAGAPDVPWHERRDVAWPVPRVPDPAAVAAFATTAVDSEHPLFIAYTSGTTGRPKGTVAVHGGFTVKVAEEGAMHFDLRPDDTLFWFTDMGWIMGPWEVTAALANGATVALYEGAPDFPGPDRLWAVLERNGATVLGISPTLVRSLMAHGDAPVRGHDLSRLRILGSTGEPWNEDPWHWYFQVVGGGRCPVINISGGTEIGAVFLGPHPVEPLKPMSLGGPGLGMAMDVFDEDGRPVRGAVGELVCTAPWPGMTRGLYKDPERYLETYWSTYPGVWRHGDWASIDADGSWFLHGRSDDTIKVAGKRLGPAEVESVLVGHPAVVEAAAVGLPDELKGESLGCYVVLAAGVEADEALRSELEKAVTDELGKAFKPSVVAFTRALPKTRNAKVLRRAIRAAAMGTDAGDLSSLEDPSSIEAVRAAHERAARAGS